MMEDDFSIKSIYSISKILANIEKGDSLSDIQRKTGLAFTTVQKIISDLARSGIVSTEIGKNTRGKIRRCTKFSLVHKRVAISFLETFNRANTVLTRKLDNDKDNINPLLFEIAIQEKLLEEIKQAIRTDITSDMANLFSIWIKSREGTVKEIQKELSKDIMEKCINDPTKMISIHSEDILYFYPQKFNVKVSISKTNPDEKIKYASTLDVYVRDKEEPLDLVKNTLSDLFST